MNTRPVLKRARAVVALVGLIAVFGGCTPQTRAARVPEQDLTPFEQLVRQWTREYQFRRTTGGSDLVSWQGAIVERPTHEEHLILEATLFSDTLVAADIARICEYDSSGSRCDSIAIAYKARHQIPEQFRIELAALANLSAPFRLEPLTIYLTDEDGIDYEPRRKVFSTPVTAQRTYLDREVTRYDPYTSWEYQVYQYTAGYEFQSTGRATLYFDRVNIIGKDLLGPGAKLTLKFRQNRTELGKITWDLDAIRAGSTAR
ncbi:MAG TPA: hypothetical protein P5569_09905 [Candidatus Latescibacteria bacterium]|nr:hypothetical protein [Candidatus Latescibacterota bacterium]